MKGLKILNFDDYKYVFPSSFKVLLQQVNKSLISGIHTDLSNLETKFQGQKKKSYENDHKWIWRTL